MNHKELFTAWVKYKDYRVFLKTRSKEERDFFNAAVAIQARDGENAQPLDKVFEKLSPIWGTPLYKALE